MSKVLVATWGAAVFATAEQGSWPSELVRADIGGLCVYLLIGLAGVYAMYLGYDQLRKKRQVENVPNSKVGGVTIGLNEIQARAVADEPLVAPFSGRKCVFYAYRVLENIKALGKYPDLNVRQGIPYKKLLRRKGVGVRNLTEQEGLKEPEKKKWRVHELGLNYCGFELHDDTGSIRVRPHMRDEKGRDVDVARFYGEKVIDYVCGPDDPKFFGPRNKEGPDEPRAKRYFQEWIVPHDEPVYVIGPVRVRDNSVEPEVAVGTGERGVVEDHFAIGAGTEEDMAKTYFRRAALYYGAGLAAGIFPAMGFGIVMANAMDDSNWMLVVSFVLLVVLWLATIGLNYLKLVYDGLVSLRHREERAWSMIDVALKRRHDLIPKLAEVVRAVSDHEKELKKSVAQLRSVGTTPRVTEGDTETARDVLDSQTEALDNIFALAEDYPDLKTNRHFERLMNTLVECEDKISLARRFYNCSVERLNTRVKSLPDRFLAPMAGAKEEEFLEFNEFEKKPVTVGK